MRDEDDERDSNSTSTPTSAPATEADAATEKAFGPFDDIEACVRRMGQEPGVDDPEALCADMKEHPEEYFQANANRVLADLEVTFVSGVGTPAQDSQFILAKSAEADPEDQNHDWQRDVDLVVKQSDGEAGADDDEAEQQKTWAPALIPEETDKEGDVVTKQDIEQAAHTFLKDYRNIDTDHELLSGKGDPIESWTLKQPQTFEKPDGTESREYPEGTWMLGVEWGDDAWKAIQDGEITGLSIYGKAQAIDLRSLERDVNHESVFQQAKALSKAVASIEKLNEDEHRRISGAIEQYFEQGGSEGDFVRDFLEWLRSPETEYYEETIEPATAAAEVLFEAGFEDVILADFIQFLADDLAAEQAGDDDATGDESDDDEGDDDEGDDDDEDEEKAASETASPSAVSHSAAVPADADTTSPAGLTSAARSIAVTATDTALVAKSARFGARSTERDESMENESTEAESGEAAGADDQLLDTLKSIQSTVEENNETVKSVSENQDAIEERLGTLEEQVESHEKALNRSDFGGGDADGESSGEADGEATGDAEKDANADGAGDDGEADGEAAKDADADADAGEADVSEDVAEETEKAVAKMLGIDRDDLPEDPAERRSVVRKNAFEVDEGWESAEDSGEAGAASTSGETTVAKSAAERAGGSLKLDTSDLPDL